MAFKKTDRLLWGCSTVADGTLGANTTAGKLSPVQVISGNDWKSVAMSQYTSAAIKTNNTLWVWGNGNIGLSTVDGINSGRSSPVQVVGGNTYLQVITSSERWSAIKTDGTLWNSGYNGAGQLGDGTTINRSSPVQTVGTGTWKLITSGGYTNNTAAIKADGTMWVWGYNNHGQLGDISTINRSSPVQLAGSWKTLSFGSYQFTGIKTDGTLWSCGYNQSGRLGDGTTIRKSSPVQVLGGGSWKHVACGYDHSTAVKTDGTLWSWGYNNQGQLGDGTTADRSSPVQTITAGANWANVYAAKYNSHGLKTDGTLWAWGYDLYGSLGDNSTINKSSPVQVVTGKKIRNVVGSGYHTIFMVDETRSEELPKTFVTKEYLNNVYPHLNPQLKSAGLWVWGENSDGQLGNNEVTIRSSPVQTVAGGTNWKIVSSGYSHKSGIKTDGTLWSWGYNNYGQFGDNSTISKSSPVQTITSGTNWKIVNAGFSANYAIKTDGTLWSWGRNDLGQLGHNDTTNKLSPVQISGGGTTWKSFMSGIGDYFMGAIKTDGTLWLWGSNQHYELGDQTATSKSTPIQTIAGGSNWKQATGVGYAVCALKNDGTLWGWGENTQYQTGLGTNLNVSTPTMIGSGNYWKQVSGGNYFCLAIKTDGTLWGWGQGTFGKLGNNSTVTISTPINIGGGNWKSVVANYSNGYGIRTDGTLWGWGQGRYIGDNSTIHKSSPVQIGTNTNWKNISADDNSVAAISEFEGW